MRKTRRDAGGGPVGPLRRMDPELYSATATVSRETRSLRT